MNNAYVEFYKLQNDGSQQVIATCQLNDDGTVVCQGDENLVANLNQKGIDNYEDRNTTLFPKDGIKFLEQLKYNFKSGYLNASDVLYPDNKVNSE